MCWSVPAVSRSFGIWTAGCEPERVRVQQQEGLWARVLRACVGLGVSLRARV